MAAPYAYTNALDPNSSTIKKNPYSTTPDLTASYHNYDPRHFPSGVPSAGAPRSSRFYNAQNQPKPPTPTMPGNPTQNSPLYGPPSPSGGSGNPYGGTPGSLNGMPSNPGGGSGGLTSGVQGGTPNWWRNPTAGASSAMGADGEIDFSGLQGSFNQSYSQNTSGSQSGLSQAGQQALNPLLGTGRGSMPEYIDRWGQDAMDAYQVNKNDIVNTLNQVANQRAAMGIMGGTEANNLRANMLTNLVNPTMQNRANVLDRAMQLKTQAVPQMLGLTQQSQSGGGSYSQSYSQSPDDYQLIAQMLNNLY